MTAGPQVKVLPVPEGSIVWLHNIADAETPDIPGTIGEDLLMGLRERVGHDNFVVLCTSGEGEIDILGPDDLVDRVRAALVWTPHTPPTEGAPPS